MLGTKKVIVKVVSREIQSAAEEYDATRGRTCV
jgi:hypothetical protein